MCLAAATAAVVASEEEDNKCDNNYPGGIVVKKIAKTVVHKCILLSRDFALDIIVCFNRKNVNHVQNVIYF